jgi:hypothetical protein
MAKCLSISEISNSICKTVEVASGYSYKVYSNAASIPALTVEELGISKNFFFSQGYWNSYESAFSKKINFRYVVICKNDAPVAFAPFQIIHFDGSNVSGAVADSGSFQKTKTWLTKKIVNLVSIKLLVSGNTFLTGELALFVKEGYILNSNLADAYNKSIDMLLSSENLSGILVKDFYTETANALSPLEKNGYLKFEVNPNMEMNIRENWKTFEDYQKDLSSKYRVRLHKALERGSKLSYRVLEVEETIQYEKELQSMLNEVLNNSDFKLFNPDIAYMRSLQLNFPDTFNLTGIFRENELIGFYSTYYNNNELVACFVGMNKSYLKEHDLYLNILYKLVQQAIYLKVYKLQFGRTAMEIKSSVGALPQHMFLFVKHVCPIRNFLVHTAVKNLSKNPEWTIRIPFKGA